MSKETTQEELNKLHKKLHEEWLKHPVTVQAIEVLKKRKDFYKQKLQEGILAKSDAVVEEKYRQCINTAEAFIQILTSQDKFIELMNQENK